MLWKEGMNLIDLSSNGIMTSKRIEYNLKLSINQRSLSKVVIDQHYRRNHPEMSDALILELIDCINNCSWSVDDEKDGFQYFAIEPVFHKNKPYRLVLLLHVEDNFLGVVNAFRVGRR